MARKSVLTKDQITEAAFELAAAEGIANITIRHIAASLNTSTAPIYTQYANRNMILQDLDSLIGEKMMAETRVPRASNDFLNVGLGIIQFVLDHRRLVSEFYFTLNRLNFAFAKDNPAFVARMKQDRFMALLNEEELLSLLSDIRVYTFGLIAEIITDYSAAADLEHYREQLEAAGAKLIREHLRQAGKLRECRDLLRADRAKGSPFIKETVLHEYDY